MQCPCHLGKNVNVRLLSHACLLLISSLRDYMLPIFVTVSSLYHPFRFVPYQWGSFFNLFHPFRFEYPSYEGTENAYHVYAMSLPIWHTRGESPWFNIQYQYSCKWMFSNHSIISKCFIIKKCKEQSSI